MSVELVGVLGGIIGSLTGGGAVIVAVLNRPKVKAEAAAIVREEARQDFRTILDAATSTIDRQATSIGDLLRRAEECERDRVRLHNSINELEDRVHTIERNGHGDE